MTAGVEVCGVYGLTVAERKTKTMVMHPTAPRARGPRDSGGRPAICPNRAVRIPGWHHYGGGRHDRRDQVPHGSSVERVSPLCQCRLRPTHHNGADDAKSPNAPSVGPGGPAVRVQYLDATDSRVCPPPHPAPSTPSTVCKLPEEPTLRPLVIVRGDSGMTGCESVKTTFRRRRLLFAGFLLRQQLDRLPSIFLKGSLVNDSNRQRWGRPEKSWWSCLTHDLKAFEISEGE